MVDILASAMAYAVDQRAPHVSVSSHTRRMQAEPWRTRELENLEKAAATMHKRFTCSNRNLAFLAQFRDLRIRSVQLYSQLLSSFIRDTVASCRSQADIWRKLGRLGLTKSKTAVSGVKPDDFADFLLDLPCGPDLRPNLYNLIPEPDASDPVAFY